MQPIITSFLLAFAFLSAVPSISAGAQETSPNSQFPLDCVARDVQLVAQLEPYDMHSDIANEAFSRCARAPGLLRRTRGRWPSTLRRHSDCRAGMVNPPQPVRLGA